MQDAVDCFLNSVNSFIEAFNGASHLSQTNIVAEALQVRLVNRAVVPLAMHLAFDLEILKLTPCLFKISDRET